MGGGIASESAARALRHEAPGASIAILCGEPVLPYWRPPLTIHPAELYERQHIALLLFMKHYLRGRCSQSS
ncbi:hypothetical protein PWP93_20815 [Paraburkholderia sp. A1RI-2L]|uniref:hypothetical protein n=1 Tax=Paraburkholderia sp. A1RI-2L TaxID=3028367 RepID=UPI003B7E04B0